MKRSIIICLVAIAFSVSTCVSAFAWKGEDPDVLASVSDSSSVNRIWSLGDCIDYAVNNNISVRMYGNEVLSGIEDVKQAKAGFLPSLSAGTNQNYTNRHGDGSDSQSGYYGTYSLSFSLPVFQGRRLVNSMNRAEIGSSMDRMSMESAVVDLKLSVISAYMQILYAMESVQVNRNAEKISQVQYERGIAMFEVGSIGKSELLQLRSQYESDRYNVTSAENALESSRLVLKQLLELEIGEEMNVTDPYAGDDSMIHVQLPSKEDVYGAALSAMPQLKRDSLGVEAAALDVKIAEAGFYPTVSLSAGISAQTVPGSSQSFQDQFLNGLQEAVGLGITIPIYSNRENVTAKNKAEIALDNSRLELESTRKEILKSVENVYLDLVSAISQYDAAVESLKAAEETFALVSEQFSIGAADIVEYLDAQNKYIYAEQSRLQAKYMALMNHELMKVYQGIL